MLAFARTHVSKYSVEDLSEIYLSISILERRS